MRVGSAELAHAVQVCKVKKCHNKENVSMAMALHTDYKGIHDKLVAAPLAARGCQEWLAKVPCTCA